MESLIGMVSVNVGSAAGGCSLASPAFYQYVLRLAEAGLSLSPSEQASLEPLGAIPHAFYEEAPTVGHGWRVVPAASDEDWSVLEATPQRLRSALQTAQQVLWRNAAPVGISAAQIVDLEAEIDQIMGVLQRAEDAGCSVSISYVS
ncbi:MAG: hypothetical protein JO101_09360 [Candidatus Eremiobacteraeota bacterium]|nr:hypothetical protein [Candidatus Eremiobacteraeota bacterium]MBV8355515.1 hypothetical protein [Candidatus Eremiobacteraeota bacterium]